jgi:4-amino-4-deoxy-L-arabinose transferase-like glycosyltransferase
MRKTEKIFLFFIFLTFFFLLNWNSFLAPFERDEGEYAYVAWLMSEGKIPYRDVFSQKPPMIFYTYYISQLINKDAVWPPRILAAIFSFFSIILVGLIAKKTWGERGFWIALFLSLPMFMFPVLTPFAANTEKFMLLPLLLVIYLYLYSSKINFLLLFLTGFFSSVAFFYKPICLPILALIFVLWFLRLKKEKKIFNFFYLFLGFFISSFFILLPFLITKTLKFFWENVFVFNFYYLKTLNNQLVNFYYLKKFLVYWWITIPFFILFFYQPVKLFWFYLLLFFLSLITVFSSPMGHYYLQIVPFFALIVTGGVIGFINFFRKEWQLEVMILAVFILIAFMIWPFRIQFYLNPQQLATWVYGRVNPFFEAEIVAQKVKEMTTPNDKVFVAGSEQEIYFYTKRKSASRLILTYPLNLNSDLAIKYQKETVDQLKKNKPKVIVLSQASHSGVWNEGSPKIFINYLDSILKKEYQLVGGYVWEGDEGSWQSPIRKEAIENSSFLVFKKYEKTQ